MNYAYACALSFFLSTTLLGQSFLENQSYRGNNPDSTNSEGKYSSYNASPDLSYLGDSSDYHNQESLASKDIESRTGDDVSYLTEQPFPAEPINSDLYKDSDLPFNSPSPTYGRGFSGYSSNFGTSSPSPYSFANANDEIRTGTCYASTSFTNNNNDLCNCCSNSWDIWIYPDYFYIGHTEGRGIGYERGYTTIGIFSAPSVLSIGRFRPFINVEGNCFNNGRWAVSEGIGTRYIASNSVVLGLNVYYDYRRIRRFDFNQIGVGFEFLSPCWDFRINGYFPVGQKNFRESRREGTWYDFSDGYFALRKRSVSAWYGFDAEVGTWIKRKYACDDWFGIYLAAGPYYYTRNHNSFFHDRRERETWGGRVRLLARIYDILDLSVIATYDDIWHTRVQGQITLAIPFDWIPFLNSRSQSSEFNSSCLLEQIAIQPVQRNGFIVADHACCWDWNWSGGGCGCGCSSSRKSRRSHNSLNRSLICSLICQDK